MGHRGGRYEVGQVCPGRVTRVAEFGAFVELEPGVEALAHASTFPPTGRAGGWARAVTVGQTGSFEILNLDTAQKRIGVAPVERGPRERREPRPCSSASSRSCANMPRGPTLPRAHRSVRWPSTSGEPSASVEPTGPQRLTRAHRRGGTTWS